MLYFWILGPLLLLSCTTPFSQNLPDAEVLPYPFHMVQKDQTLIINSTNADGRYSFGRLMAINTEALDNYLKSDKPKSPIAAKEVVRANTLIPSAVGTMAVGNDLVFASGETNLLYKVALTNNGFSCARPNQSIAACSGVTSIALSGMDPLMINTFKGSASEEIIVVAFASSNDIDLIRSTKEGLSKIKHINTLEMVNKKLSEKIPEDEFIIIKKIQVEEDKIYVLLEHEFKSLTTRLTPKASFLMSVSVSDFLNKEKLDAEMLSLWNLRELFSISAVHDSFIDGTTAYVLGKSPEALFKIDLSHKLILDTATGCMSASSLSVSKSMNRIITPCFGDNRVASFSMSPLVLEFSTPVLGQGPIYALIDESKKYIYVSFFKEGKLVILDESLRYLGHIFEPASPLKGPSS